MTVPEAYLQDIVWPANFNEIPKEIFVRQDLYQAEIARIFRRAEWHPVAHESEVPHPGDYKTCNIVDVPLLIIRGDDDRDRAFFNAYSHRTTPIDVNTSGKDRKSKRPNTRH